jgi:ABC-2 type transport system permease protein
MNKLLSNTPNYTIITILAFVYLAGYLYFVIRKFKTDDL